MDIFARRHILNKPTVMKKIFFTLLCAAVMVSCGGNKEKAHECDGNHTECTHQHSDCDGSHEDCTGECESGAGECDNCASKSAPAVDTNIGCIQVDNEMFLNKIADYKNPEWKYLGDKPAVIDFYADWCGPCKRIAPALEEIAKEYAGKVNVYKVNVDNCPEVAQAYGITSIPTLFFVPVEGAPLKAIGMMSKEEIVANIAKIMQ